MSNDTVVVKDQLSFTGTMGRIDVLVYVVHPRTGAYQQVSMLGTGHNTWYVPTIHGHHLVFRVLNDTSRTITVPFCLARVEKNRNLYCSIFGPDVKYRHFDDVVNLECWQVRPHRSRDIGAFQELRGDDWKNSGQLTVSVEGDRAFLRGHYRFALLDLGIRGPEGYHSLLQQTDGNITFVLEPMDVLNAELLRMTGQVVDTWFR